jgi:hypothetical protein
LNRKKEGLLYAGENKPLEGGRKKFECPNFDPDDVDELSHTLILKNSGLCLSLNNHFSNEWLGRRRPTYWQAHSSDLKFLSSTGLPLPKNGNSFTSLRQIKN